MHYSRVIASILRMEDLLSDKLPLSKCVPQGSILGPTLFETHFNITHTAERSHIHLDADDTILYTSSASLNTGPTNFYLHLNTSKTKPIKCSCTMFSLDNSNNQLINPLQQMGVWLDCFAELNIELVSCTTINPVCKAVDGENFNPSDIW